MQSGEPRHAADTFTLTRQILIAFGEENGKRTPAPLKAADISTRWIAIECRRDAHLSWASFKRMTIEHVTRALDQAGGRSSAVSRRMSANVERPSAEAKCKLLTCWLF